MSLIYEPKGKAREYAALACNIYRGCDHGCTYCYAPQATHVSREQFAQPGQRVDFLAKLWKEAAELKPTEPILLCFSTDPYCQYDAEVKITRETIKILHAAGHRVTVLTKGGTRALRDLDLFGPGDSFGVTLTTLDTAKAAEFEPNAASPIDRCEALRVFDVRGIHTWVSLEPVIDPAQALKIIGMTQWYVDLYKVGRWNYDPRAKEIDWRKFATDAVTLLQSLGKDYYIKKDLACFLPAAWRAEGRA